MMIKDMDRRQFILRLSRIAVAISAAGWFVQARAGDTSGANVSAHNQAALIAELSYQLLPIQAPQSALYQSVVHALMNQLTQRPGAAELIRQGVEAFNGFAGKPWLELTAKERRQVIQALFDTPFVSMVRWTTQEVVLRDRQIWNQLGYQGSSIEKGGYLHRGFDDIDWLPEAPREIKQ